jgi:deoxyadenosine/deoxycytidine kinase
MFKIVSIEGNIGSGKTTLLEHLRNHYINNENVIFLREPVEDWEKIKDKNGNTILQKFYADQHKYSFSFQIMAYISRLKILRDAIKSRSNSQVPYIIITERSLYTDKNVFAKMLFEQGKIEDVCYQIYLNWFNEFVEDYPVKHLVYVNTDPSVCYERIHTRARNGEELIPLSYLSDCHNNHELYINDNTNITLTLNGNIDIFKNENTLLNWIKQIDEFIN